MLRIVRHEGPVDEPDVQYALIWNWRTQKSRRLVGHRGWMPGIAHSMMTNAERSLGVILLSSGDITWGDALAQQVSATLVNLMDQLFNCYEQVALHSSTRLQTVGDFQIMTFVLSLYFFAKY